MRKGFTLIELLVVIAIIGGLAALLFPNFMSARQLARDAQRKSDLKQLQKALEIYRQDQSASVFPTPNANSLGTVNSSWSGAGGTIYMPKMPGDPLGTIAAPTPYLYKSASPYTTYSLCACIENVADPDPNVVSANCSGSYTCSSGKSYLLNQP